MTDAHYGYDTGEERDVNVVYDPAGMPPGKTTSKDTGGGASVGFDQPRPRLKAVVLVVDDARAEPVARIIASALASNGYADVPAVIDWSPVTGSPPWRRL